MFVEKKEEEKGGGEGEHRYREKGREGERRQESLVSRAFAGSLAPSLSRSIQEGKEEVEENEKTGKKERKKHRSLPSLSPITFLSLFFRAGGSIPLSSAFLSLRSERRARREESRGLEEGAGAQRGPFEEALEPDLPSLSRLFFFDGKLQVLGKK